MRVRIWIIWIFRPDLVRSGPGLTPTVGGAGQGRATATPPSLRGPPRPAPPRASLGHSGGAFRIDLFYKPCPPISLHRRPPKPKSEEPGQQGRIDVRCVAREAYLLRLAIGGTLLSTALHPYIRLFPRTRVESVSRCLSVGLSGRTLRSLSIGREPSGAGRGGLVSETSLTPLTVDVLSEAVQLHCAARSQARPRCSGGN